MKEQVSSLFGFSKLTRTEGILGCFVCFSGRSRFVFLFGLPKFNDNKKEQLGLTVKGSLKIVFEFGFCDKEDFKGS